jgi:hypothetical protein
VNFAVSQPIKIAALVGLLAIVGLGATTMMLGKTKAQTPPPAQERTGSAHRQRVVTPPAKTHTTATAAPAKTPAKHQAKTKPASHAKTKPVAVTPARTHHKTTVKRPAVARRSGNLVYADLPAPLQWQLSQHKVVVVSLYNPNANVDTIAVAEAHQGAADAGAGFLLVSVLDNKVAGILTGLLPGGGLLPAPGILVYRAPGNIATRIDGFADRVSVAQAAQNAITAQFSPAPAASTPAASAVTAAGVTPPAATLTP